MSGRMMLDDLILRLERTTGPDRELDKEINRAVKYLHRKEGYALHFTSSNDAAMQLVPEGWSIQIRRYASGKGLAEIWDHERLSESKRLYSVESVTPEIATCIAALKARRALSGEGK